MKLIPPLSSMLHVSRVSGCRYKDIQLTNIIRRSVTNTPLSSYHTCGRRRQTSSFCKGLVQTQQQQQQPILSSRRNITTNTAAKNTSEDRNEKLGPGNNNNEEDAASLSHRVRLLMRRVPHPVAIITASDNHSGHASQDDKPVFRGMTVSSFNTVTLHPEPVVSFNVRRPSETLNALQSSGRFLVHLLTPSAATAKLARDFSRGNEHLEELYKQEGLGEFEFGALPASWTAAAAKATSNQEFLPYYALPILRRRKNSGENSKLAQQQESEIDFPFIFECAYLPKQTIQIHDHTIVLGSVIRVLEQNKMQPQGEIIIKSDGEGQDFCLTYADTRFWKMGDEI